jgi:hypothetical protein
MVTIYAFIAPRSSACLIFQYAAAHDTSHDATHIHRLRCSLFFLQPSDPLWSATSLDSIRFDFFWKDNNNESHTLNPKHLRRHEKFSHADRVMTAATIAEITLKVTTNTPPARKNKQLKSNVIPRANRNTASSSVSK